MRGRHQHVWVIESEREQPSAFDQMTAKVSLSKMSNVYKEFFVRPVIITYRCTLCTSQKVERV